MRSLSTVFAASKAFDLTAQLLGLFDFEIPKRRQVRNVVSRIKDLQYVQVQMIVPLKRRFKRL